MRQVQTSIDGVIFENNLGGEGGALHILQSIFSISDCIFSQNEATQYGGAIMLNDSTGAINEGTEIRDNHAGLHGGGVLVDNGSDVIFDTVVFDGNSADITGGGLKNISMDSTTVVRETTFENNSAEYGGGIYNNGRITVEQTLLTANSSDDLGGGIYNAGAMFKLINSTVSGNASSENGGGIVCSGTCKIMFSTIANNQGNNVGGVFNNSGNISIKNSIIAYNSGHNCGGGGGFTALGDNLDNEGTCPGFTILADPGLAPLADNGGATLTHAFIYASPAVDGAPDCTNTAGGTAINEDQRGEPRPYGSQCDLGAYEAQSTPAGFQAMIEVVVNQLDCLEGPFEGAAWMASYYQGDSLAALGRNEDGTWLGIAGMNGSADEVACWVPSDGVESPEAITGFPLLASEVHPPEPGVEENGYNRCDIFEPETYSLILLDIPYGTGDLTISVGMPGGVPGLELEIPEDLEPWIYTGDMGGHTIGPCTFDGYAERLFCRGEIPETFFGTVRVFNLFVNGCEDEIYTHGMVTIPEPVAPLTCSAGLDEADCEAAGGTYTCGATSACECVCP
jgi:predicted outer membrane repeat protein